jgi:hypothetical protein
LIIESFTILFHHDFQHKIRLPIRSDCCTLPPPPPRVIVVVFVILISEGFSPCFMEEFSFGFTEDFSLEFLEELLEGYSPGSWKYFSFQLKQAIVGRNWHSITRKQRTEGRILSRLCHSVLFLLKQSIAGRFWQLITLQLFSGLELSMYLSPPTLVDY